MNILAKSKSWVKNTIIITFVIFWCVCSSCLYFKQHQELQYKLTDTEYNTTEILQGDIFLQEIRINKYIDNLKLFVANGGGNRAETNNGSIEFLLSQDDVVEIATIEIAGIQDWTYIDVPVDLDKFNDGIAQLQIKGIDTKAGSSIYFVSLKNDIYELSAATYNNSKLDGPLSVEYTTYNSNFNGSYFVVLMVLIVLVGVALVLLLTYNPKDIYIYLATTIIIALIIALKYPTYTIGGEAWAEVGVLYVPTALNSGFIENILTLEAGLYVNLIGRFITWFFVKTMPSLYYAVHGINISSLIILSFMGASLSSGVLKKYIKPLECVTISILLTTCLVDGETIATPLITSYWAIIPLLIIMAAMVLKIKIPKKILIIWSILIFVSVLSRMSYVIFIPIIIIYIIWFRKKLTRDNVIYFFTICLLCLVEGVVSLVLRKLNGITGVGSISIPSPVELINSVLYYQVQIVNSIFKMQTSNDFDAWNICVLIALVALIIMLLWCVLRKMHVDYAKAALLMIAISFGQCCLQIITEGFSPLASGIDWSVIQSLSRNRQWLFCYIAILSLALLSFKYYKYKICIKNEQKTKISEKIIICYVLAVAFCVQPNSAYASVYNMSEDIGDWNNYSEMIYNNTSYSIPISPGFDWLTYDHNCLIKNGNVSLTNQVELNIEASEIVNLYIYRSKITNQIEQKDYYVCLYDANGEEIDRIRQVSDLEESLIGFTINDEINGLSKVSFFYEDGSDAYVEGSYLIAYNI